MVSSGLTAFVAPTATAAWTPTPTADVHAPVLPVVTTPSDATASPATSPSQDPEDPSVQDTGAPKGLTFHIGAALLAAFAVPVFMLAARGRREQ